MGEELKEMTSYIRKAACHAVGRRGDRRRKQGVSENQALEKGLKAKAKEFADKGAEVYAKT